MKLTIDTNQPLTLAQEAGKFVFKKEAEEQLVKLLELQKLVNQAVDEAKRQIREAGESIDPSFRGVIGEKVKAIYRTYGAKYTYRMNEIEIAKPFLKEKIYYSVDSGVVDEFVKKEGKLPEGIYDKERTKSISFTLQNKLLED